MGEHHGKVMLVIPLPLFRPEREIVAPGNGAELGGNFLGAHLHLVRGVGGWGIVWPLAIDPGLVATEVIQNA